MNPYILLAFDIILVSTAHLLLKKASTSLHMLDFSSKAFHLVILDLILNPFLIIGLFFYGLSFVLWIIILSKVHLHVAYPISVSLVITTIAIASALIYKETISTLQITGMVIIILGVCLVLFQK